MQLSHTSILAFLLLLPIICNADSFASHTSYTVCFTPQENCTQKIVAAIDSAKNNIQVQAYSFTSHPIGNALAAAKKRGVNVQIILDQSHLNRQSTARFFVRHHIPVWIDQQAAIAHNKVILIDQKEVITGSFNFTHAAQFDNTENVLIISDTKLTKKYLNNWRLRKMLSEKFIAN